MANAVVEELVFRGPLQVGLQRCLADGSGPARRALAVLGSAFVFGVALWQGVPSGVSGMALAFLYGLMLGVLRDRAGGLLSPWIAHIVADATIYVLLLSAVR